MNATVNTKLTLSISLDFDESQARALAHISGYSDKAFADSIGKYAHDCAEGEKHHNALKSFLKELQKLHAPLKEIDEARKRLGQIKL